MLAVIFNIRASAPEPGIWNFANLTGESNYVGVVKNAFKGSRLDIRWVQRPFIFYEQVFTVSPGWTVRQNLLLNHSV